MDVRRNGIFINIQDAGTVAGGGGVYFTGLLLFRRDRKKNRFTPKWCVMALFLGSGVYTELHLLVRVLAMLCLLERKINDRNIVMRICKWRDWRWISRSTSSFAPRWKVGLARLAQIWSGDGERRYKSGYFGITYRLVSRCVDEGPPPRRPEISKSGRWQLCFGAVFFGDSCRQDYSSRSTFL